jgi:NADPH:quinone reductase-like Zn-dependent oxidoreductase
MTQPDRGQIASRGRDCPTTRFGPWAGRERLARSSWGDAVHLVLDGVGGELVQRGVDALNPFGRLVVFSAG